MALGVRGEEVLFTYVKPCHGTFVMGIDSPEEIARLRESESRNCLSYTFDSADEERGRCLCI